MKKNIYKILEIISSRRSFTRQIILVFLDIILLNLSLLISIFFISDNFIFTYQNKPLPFLFITIFGIFIYLLTGQYKNLTRFANSTLIYKISLRNLILTIVFFIYNALFFEFYNLKLSIIFWLMITGSTGSIRFIFRDILKRINHSYKGQIANVAIYGGGNTGVNLHSILMIQNTHKVITFIDDDSTLYDRKINGIPIRNKDHLKTIKDKIDEVLIAIPSLNNKKLSDIFEYCKSLDLKVYKIPTIDDLTKGKVKINDLKPIFIEDLLCRKAVAPYKELLSPNIYNKNICITGAGGSIGSELCKIILPLKPKRLILIEQSESNLYEINKLLLNSDFSEGLKIFPLLGDCKDEKFMTDSLKRYKVHSLFHAAAYKHVPLVEINPIAGIRNNVLSTLTICKASNSANLKNVILISTDKAVRPTNVMGASKRLCEIIFQTYAKLEQINEPNKKTKFSMVRFGNVLGSSGSVVPLFKEQIKRGGPITITHKEIIRYFMTIKEAANLVIQATSLAKGGDIFLLDMGDPVKINFLAEQMIKLTGRKIKNKENPDGDIEIKYIGLREGEKLFEELLIDAESIPTAHPLIYRANEKINFEEKYVFEKLAELEKYLSEKHELNSLKILKELVPEWVRN